RRAAVAEATWPTRAAALEAILGVAAPDDVGPTVSVVVVTRDAAALLERCLSALAGQGEVEREVIVVDNDSSDGTARLLEERFPEARVLALAENAGFARANNLAFSECRGELVLLLNND